MFHIIYQTTNLVNNMIYIGKHSTKNLKDGYIGSGKELKEAIKIFGKQNFICEALFFAFSEEDVYQVESTIVDANFLLRSDVYNKKPGGKGAASGIYNHNYGKTFIFTDEHKAKISLTKIGERNPMYGKTGNTCPNYGKQHTEDTKIKISESVKKHFEINPIPTGEDHHWFGSKHKEESKLLMRQKKYKWSYTITDPEGNLYHTNNMTQFCKDHPSIHQTNMSVYGHSKGWTVTEKLPFELDNHH